MKTIEELKQINAKYYQNNKEQIKQNTKKYRQNNKDKVRSGLLAWNYGITLAQYDEIFAIQNGVCAICKKPQITIDKRTNKVKNLYVDHCHETREVRGLLCSTCNTGLGHFKSNPELLEFAAKYLKKVKT